jgi:integrase
LGITADGKRRRKTVYGHSKKEVQDKIRDILNRVAAGTMTDTGRLTVAEYLSRWLENTAKREVREGTWTRYEQLIRLRINPTLGGIKLSKLAPVHIEQLFADLDRGGISKRGSQMAGTMLHTALAYAVSPLHLIPTNPARDVAKPKPQEIEMKVLDPDQVTRFLAESQSDRLYPLYILAIESGMREGELFALEWSDIDFPSKSVQVKRALKEVGGRVWTEELKTAKSRRRVEVSLFTLDILNEHRQTQLASGTLGRLVFPDTEGNYLRRPNVARRSFFPILQRAGLPRIRFHDLRHTAATLLLLANEHVKVVSERLGHSTTQVTLNRYTHVLPTMQERAAETMGRILGNGAATRLAVAGGE